MSPRLRKFIGMIVMAVFSVIYIVVAVALSGLLPDNKAAQLAYYAIAGVAWCLPLFPLITWMSRE